MQIILLRLCFLVAESSRDLERGFLILGGKISLLGLFRNRLFFESTVSVNST